jgi:chemotaxis receptor (MCP) glutamine deamidase CheD
MNHILLPEGAKEEGRARFGVHAMELLINRMMILGADRRRLVAKAFGGGNVLTCLLPPTVGDLNAKFVHNFLALEGIRLMAHRLGGESAVEIRFRTDTGKVSVRIIKGSPLSTIAAREETYSHAPPVEGDITIF